MLKSPKLLALWKSYENAVEHVPNFGQHQNHQTRVHLSRTASLTTHVIKVFVVSILGIGLGLLLMQASLVQQLSVQEINLALQQRLSFLLVFYSIYFAVAIVALVLKNMVYKGLKPAADLFLLMWLLITLTPLALVYSFQPILLFVNLVFCILMLLVGKKMAASYSFAGINFYLASCLGIIIGLAWGVNFFNNLEASFLTKFLLVGTTPLLLVTLPSGFIHMLELYDIVCREHWHRPRHPFPENSRNYEPFVSIHVPTYSEPPELVIETINKLAEVDYENYEVIVVDNNTKDPELWLPVKAHCEQLGGKFRFMHIENIQGAKGGALNHIHKYIDPRASIIAVIDADYQPEKSFLKSLVGHFADPKIGFVQSPHDYREWKNNLFLTMCYWEYKIFFHTAMISLNERDAGITVGTMCLIRKEALEKAGGWSEWCVTEDSELAIRIHDAGYSSIYVDRTYGRGLIPESFEGYKMQRYRWTAGPVQEFRHYYPHFIGLSRKDTKFTFVQRMFHINHGLHNILLAFNIPLMLLGVGLVASMIYHQEIIQVPFELWVTATVTLLATPMLTFLLYRVTIKATIPEMIGQAIAGKALSHVIFHSALRTTITGNAKWNRTSKFKATQSYFSALDSTKEEIILGITLLVFIIVARIIFPFPGLVLMLLIGLTYVSLEYFAAPLMAIIGVWSMAHEAAHSSDDTQHADRLKKT